MRYASYACTPCCPAAAVSRWWCYEKRYEVEEEQKGRDGVKKTQREKKENLQRFSSHYVLRASLEGTSDPWDLELKKKISFFYFFTFFLPGAEVDKDSSTCLLADRAAKKKID